MVEQGDFYKLVDRFTDLYISYRQRYILSLPGATMFVPKKDDKPIPLDNKRICGHIGQHYAIGVYAGKVASKFICFDVDDDDPEVVEKILEQLHAAGVPREYINVSLSGRKGYHIDICFEDMVRTEAQKKLYEWVIDNGGLDRKRVEFRPTYKQAIKLPLSKHSTTGNACWYVDPETLVPIQSAKHIFQIKQMPVAMFMDLADALVTEDDVVEPPQAVLHPEKKTLEKRTTPHDWSSGKLPEIEIAGTRHELMISIAARCRSRDNTRPEARYVLEEWYRDQVAKHPSLIASSEANVLKDIDGILTWAYDDAFQSLRKQPPDDAVMFTPEDVTSILEMSKGAVRKVYFFIMVWCKRYGYNKVTYTRLAELIAVSTATAKRCMKKLVDEGRIILEQGATHISDNAYKRECNKYRLSAYRPDSLLGEPSSTGVYVEAEKVNDPKAFLRIYWTTMTSMFSPDVTEKVLSNNEWKELHQQNGERDYE